MSAEVPKNGRPKRGSSTLMRLNIGGQNTRSASSPAVVRRAAGSASNGSRAERW